MSYTFTEHRTDGSTTTFSFRFAGEGKAYLRSSDVVVYLKSGDVWTEATGWSLSGTNQITFLTPPAASSDINMRIRRIVPKEVPYAEFARGPALDMRSLNYTFIQQLQAFQELMDGFFPSGFYYKEDLNMGWHRIVNMMPGTEGGHAVNKSQLDEVDTRINARITQVDTDLNNRITQVDNKHTVWNQSQDMEIAGLKASLSSGTSHRTIPWAEVAQRGQTFINPPYTFREALVFIDGVLQVELLGAVEIANNAITLAEPLKGGEDILVLVGSRIASPEDGVAEVNIYVAEGSTAINLNVDFRLVTVYLDGLKQPTSAYRIENQTIVFNEPLPECQFSGLVVIPAGG